MKRSQNPTKWLKRLIRLAWIQKRLRLAKLGVLLKVSLIQTVGLAPLMLELEKLGGWPLLQGDDWKEDEFNW